MGGKWHSMKAIECQRLLGLLKAMQGCVAVHVIMRRGWVEPNMQEFETA
jgi:hypothetical protein